MKLYMAPMEGITGHIFRNCLNQYFGEGIDKFYTPFLTPHEKKTFTNKEIREIGPEYNVGIKLVPQVLTNDADDFVRMVRKLRDIGYYEVNLNLGCPSKTVTGKGRGSGALRDLDSLHKLLEGIFTVYDSGISIKSRIGVDNPEEFDKILDIYCEYPLYELTIHPRVMKQMYRGMADRKIFVDSIDRCDFPLCYNGDISSAEDYRDFVKMAGKASNVAADNISAVMIGRAALVNPGIFREIAGGKSAEAQEIYDFLCKLKSDYSQELSGKTPLLYKMKEVWSYLGRSYPDKEKEYKKLMKCKSLEELDIYTRQILLHE